MLNSPPLPSSCGGSSSNHFALRAVCRSLPRMMPVVHRRGPWLKSEDECLRQLVRAGGAHSWVEISKKLGSRTPKQCRERYHQNLKPSLRHDPISQEEGETILRLVSEIGPKWAEIARKLPGRSDNAVKNWYNGSQHRRKRGPVREHHSLPSYNTHQGYYPYPQARSQVHAHEYAHAYPPSPQTRLPPLRNIDTSAHRSPTINLPSISSSPGSKAPAPGHHHLYQPVPLPIPHGYSTRNHEFETPLSSPGYAPSLVTDNGSETRSPHGALSPLEVARQHPSLYPEDRRPSAPESRYLLHHEDLRRRSSVQLAPLNVTRTMAPARDLQYQPAAPQSQAYSPPVPQHARPELPAPSHSHSHSHGGVVYPYPPMDSRRSSASAPSSSRAGMMRIDAIM